MKSTVVTKTPTTNHKVTYSFGSEAKAEHATKYLNKMIKGVVAKKSTNTLSVQAETLSSLFEAEEIVYDLGGQKIKN